MNKCLDKLAGKAAKIGRVWTSNQGSKKYMQYKYSIFLRGLFAMSSIFTCPDLIAFHLSHVFTSGILHDYLLNDYRISSQGENVSINQWHINSRCIFYVGYISPVKVIILNYLVILSRKHTWNYFIFMLYYSYVIYFV